MKRLRTFMALAILLCLAPLVSTFTASAVASAGGCMLHEGYANPCIVVGFDVGDLLYQMFVLGWFMLLTLPLAALLVLAWIVTEVVTRLRARRAVSPS